MDSFLLTKALNYHGQELLRAIETEHKDQLRCVDLRSLDYHEYHKRAKDFRFKERQRRQKFIRFIGKKACQLFLPPDPNQESPSWDDASNQDLCAVMPPLETFMSVPLAERRRHFFQNLRRLDLVIGQVIGRQENGLRLNIQLLCMDGGKERDIFDLGIKVSCHFAYVGTAGKNTLNPLEEYRHKDYVRALVTDISPNMEKIKILMKSELVTKELQALKNVKLGVISEEEVPEHHKNYMMHPGRTYSQVLEQILGFSNPATVDHMCKVLGLPPNKLMSMMKALHRKSYPRDHYAVELRKDQSAKWAYKSVEDGVAHFKAGNQVEAFQCLDKALEIHPDNVGALVARGALYANSSNLLRALEDFERALQIDPNDVNGKKYVYDTLIALGRFHEDKGEIEEAAKMYRRAIDSDSSNALAREYLMALEMREQHNRMMAAAMEQQLVPAPLPVMIQDPLAAFPYDAQDQLETFLYEEQQVSDPVGPPNRPWVPPNEMAAVVHHMPMHDIRQLQGMEPRGNWPRQQHVRGVTREPAGYRPPPNYGPRRRYVSEESVGYRSHEGNEREPPPPPYRGEEERKYADDRRPRRRYQSEEDEEPQDYRTRQQSPVGKYNKRESESYGSRRKRERQLENEEDYDSSLQREPEGYRSRSQRSSESKEELQRYKKRKSKEKKETHGKLRRRHSRKMDSSSSRSSSFSGSGSLTSTSKGMPPSPLQQRALSPKVAFVMRKDDDVHYSKVYTHSTFRGDDDDDDNDDRSTSVKGSREGCSRFKDSADKISLSSISSNEEIEVTPRRSRRHSSSEDDDRHRRPRHRPKERHHSDSRRFQQHHNWMQNREPTTNYRRPYGGGQSYHRRPPFNTQRGKRTGGVLINLVQSPDRLKRAGGNSGRVPEPKSSGEGLVISHVPVLESKWDRLETEEEPVIGRIPNIKTSKTVDDELSNNAKGNSLPLPAKVVKPNDPPPAWTLKGMDHVNTVKKRKDSFGAIKAATERIRKAHVRKAATVAKKLGPHVAPFTWKT